MKTEGEVQLDFKVNGLGMITLSIGYEASYSEGWLQVRYVQSEDEQDVETLFDEDAIYQECWEALEL